LAASSWRGRCGCAGGGFAGFEKTNSISGALAWIVLASLNHPNIAPIYGVEDRALVMELPAGPTLADRIAQDP
jgi:hypothetical protein